jgi:RND family efflux transporter MFP subunit
VDVVRVAEEPFERAVTVTGTLAAEERVALSFRVTGRVEQLLVDLGSSVRRGQILARLMSTDYELRVMQAEAALKQALARLGVATEAAANELDPERTALVRQNQAVRQEARLRHDRIKTFVAKGISSRADLDAAEAALEIAESRYVDALEEILNRKAIVAQRRSELALAREQLEGAVLRSPLDGAVSERHVSVGEHRTPGADVFTVVRTDPLRLRLAVPERVSAGLQAGQAVRVQVEGDSSVYAGQLTRLGAAIDESNRTLPVEAVVPNPTGALRPGTFATAQIVVDAHHRALVIPAGSVVTFAGVQKVLTVVDGKIREVRVTAGRRQDKQVEIVQGLHVGDLVVVEPGGLSDGMAVRVDDISKPIN